MNLCSQRIFSQALGQGLLCLSLVSGTAPASEPAPATAPARSPGAQADYSGLLLQGAQLADGGVFLPKPAQHQLGIRTQAVTQTSVAHSLELSGQVVSDPNHSGAIQATQSGVIQVPPDGGLPNLGQAVKRGQVLGLLKPVLNAVQRGELLSDLAAVEKDIGLNQKLLERIREQAVTGGINISIQQETYVIEYKGLLARKEAINAALAAKAEPLTAPVDGVVSQSEAFIGKVVEAGDTLFEIVDPAHLWVEALNYDTALATPAQGATGFTRDGVKLPLEYMGQAYHLRNQAVPLQFRITGNTGLMLALGQTIQVFVQTATQAQGFLLPRASVAQGADDKAQVWVHHAAEVFSPRTVRVQAVDEATVLVVEGLAAGDHVVTAGAQLLSQVR
jgi:hypothetical protein